MELRFYLDAETGIAHIEGHGSPKPRLSRFWSDLGKLAQGGMAHAAARLPALAADPNARWFTRRDATSAEKGPFDTTTLKIALRQGNIGGRGFVRKDGESEWSTFEGHPVFDSDVSR